jgi:hypothetical protein
MTIANAIVAAAALCALAFCIVRFWFDRGESVVISAIVAAVALILFWLVGSSADYVGR